MKRMISLMLCIAICAVSLPAAARADGEKIGGNNPMLSGMFVAPELVSGTAPWEFGDWDAAFGQLKAAGMDKVVVQYSVQYYSDTVKTHYYHPGFEEAETGSDNCQQQIPLALQAAKKNGMKLWLGLHIAEGAWFPAMDRGFSDVNAEGKSEFLLESAAYSEKVFLDLWEQFGGEYGDTIGGWYLPFEYNNTVQGTAKRRLIEDFYQPVTAAIKKVTPQKPILISPLIYTPLTTEATADALALWKSLCLEVWRDSQIDVIAPQDGCGWESTMKENLAPFYRTMAEARDEVQAARGAKGWGKAVAWNNPECYNMNGTPTMTVRRLTDNMKAVDSYVSGHVSFSLHSLCDLPGKDGVNPTNGIYYDAYRYYAQNGTLFTPKKPIPAVADLKAVPVNETDVALSFARMEESEAEMPVAGYQIWRNRQGRVDSEAIKIKEVSQPDSSVKTVTVLDAQPEPGISYEYMVYAFDGTGNRSKDASRVSVRLEGEGIALNREYGEDIFPALTVDITNLLNAERVGYDGIAAVKKADENGIAKFSVMLDGLGEKEVGFLYLNFLHMPAADAYLPEKIDVLADGKAVCSIYPLRDYFDAQASAIWLPVDLKGTVAAGRLEIRITQKYGTCWLNQMRIYESFASESASEGYVEPENLVQGQPVMITGYSATQGFVPDEHFRGIDSLKLDRQKGEASTETLMYKGNYATRILTRGSRKTPLINWSEDGVGAVPAGRPSDVGRSTWLRLINLGSPFELAVDLKTPSTVKGIETEWLVDQDATVFLPSYIEYYGMTVGGTLELIGKASKPSLAQLDFDRAPSADNCHRVEAKSYRAVCETDTLYKKIVAKVYPQYPANSHFIRSLTVF